MRNSKIKTIVRAAAFIILLSCVLSLLNYAFTSDNTFTRLMMHEMYTTPQPIDCVFISGSIAYGSFDTAIMDETLGMYTFNAGSASQTPDASYFLMKEIFKNNSPRYCIFGTSYVSFLDLDFYDNPIKDHILFDYYKPSLNKTVYAFHAFKNNALFSAALPFMRHESSLGAVPGNIALKRSKAYREYSPETFPTDSRGLYKGRGFVHWTRRTEDGMVGKLEPHMFSPEKIDPMKVEYFSRLVKLCKQHNCELIMIPTPIPYASMALQDDYSQVTDFYKELAESNGVTMFDYSLSRPELFEYRDSNFYDAVHMNGPAAERFSLSSGKLIRQYLQHQPIEYKKLFYGSYEEMLKDNPRIFNTWMETDDNGSVKAFCTHGGNVIPEYAFFCRTTENDVWKEIQPYSGEAILDAFSIPADAGELLVKARPRGSIEEYQQKSILSR